MRERERETEGEIVVMDVCPSCGGIWLDKGELEKLTRAESRVSTLSRGESTEEGGGHGGGSSGGHGGDNQQGRKRRGGFFGNLFDD